MNTEEMMRAAIIMRDSAEKAERAAGRMEDAAHRISVLLEDGYGNNATKLIELLEKLPTP